MKASQNQDRRYQVVQFIDDYMAGETETVVASDLTLEEANEIFARQRAQGTEDDLAIVDTEHPRESITPRPK